MEPVKVFRYLSAESHRPDSQRVVLEVERRQFLKRKWQATAPDGLIFDFDLESRLVDGAVIHTDGRTDYLIRQLPEKVYEIPFVSPGMAAEAGWKIGNLHLPAEVLPDRVRVLHDPMVLPLLEQEGWQFTEPTVLFHPLKAMPHPPG